jgi:hypothetical protein
MNPDTRPHETALDHCQTRIYPQAVSLCRECNSASALEINWGYIITYVVGTPSKQSSPEGMCWALLAALAAVIRELFLLLGEWRCAAVASPRVLCVSGRRLQVRSVSSVGRAACIDL